MFTHVKIKHPENIFNTLSCYYIKYTPTTAHRHRYQTYRLTQHTTKLHTPTIYIFTPKHTTLPHPQINYREFTNSTTPDSNSVIYTSTTTSEHQLHAGAIPNSPIQTHIRITFKNKARLTLINNPAQSSDTHLYYKQNQQHRFKKFRKIQHNQRK